MSKLSNGSPADRHMLGVAAGAALLLFASGVLAPSVSAQGAVDGNVRVHGTQVVPLEEPMPRLGRAGPPGSFVTNADMAPVCRVALARAGFPTTRITCPDQLATRPGLTAQCIATGGGRTASAITTFLDFDPATGRGATHCRLNSVIDRVR